VIAGGDIVVFGVMRGVAHAGANNTPGSVIIAQALRPTQLRIAEHIGIGPAEQPRAGPATRPEVAFVSEGTIVVVPYLSNAWRALEEKWRKVRANGRKNHRRHLR
jgi:septum site-determining protein MinC